MPIMSDRQSVALNATSANVCAGKLHEYVAQRAIVGIYATASAVGLNITVLVGGRILCQDQEVNAQNRMPIRPDDLIVQTGCLGGERIFVTFRNTTGAAITAFSVVEITPL